MEERFVCWGGTGWPSCWSDFLGVPKENCVVVWPIVDRQAGHSIAKGYPEPHEWHAVAFTSEAQAEIAKLLNEKHNNHGS